jgi:hypothetical protein
MRRWPQHHVAVPLVLPVARPSPPTSTHTLSQSTQKHHRVRRRLLLRYARGPHHVFPVSILASPRATQPLHVRIQSGRAPRADLLCQIVVTHVPGVVFSVTYNMSKVGAFVRSTNVFWTRVVSSFMGGMMFHFSRLCYMRVYIEPLRVTKPIPFVSIVEIVCGTKRGSTVSTASRT